MFTQDGANEAVFVFTSSIDSELLITQSSSFQYRKWLDGEILSSSLTNVTNGCSKFGIYISEWWGFTQCSWSM